MSIYLGESAFSGSNGSHFRLRMYIDSYSQSIENNNTWVRFHIYLVSLDNYSGSGNSTNAYINGNWVGSTTAIGKNATVDMGYWDTIFVHDSTDGTGGISWSGSISSPWSGLGSASLNGYWTAPTIPRTSGISCTDGAIESSVSININRANSGFTHTLRYAFGNLSGTIATGVETSYGWTLPTTFYAQIPNSKTGIGTIYCDTYNGSTLLGTSSTSFTAKTDEDKCKPTVSATAVDNNTTTKALTGDENILVKFISNVLVTTTATAKNSSTIKQINVTCGDGKSGTGTTVTLNKVESGTFTITVTDSRGYQTILLITKNIKDYVPLTLNATFERAEPTTGEVNVTYSGNYFNNSFGNTSNTLTIKYRYKESTSDTWSNYITLTPTKNNNTYSQTVSLGTQFDYKKAYNFEIQAVDKISTVTDNTKSVTEGIPMMALFKDYIEMFGKEVFRATDENLYLNVDLIYPVGSIYMSINDTDPSTLFGGEWESWGSGRVPVGVDIDQAEFKTVEQIGGSKYLQSHTHDAESAGGHTHSMLFGNSATGVTGTNVALGSGSFGYDTASMTIAGEHNHVIKSAGEGDSGNLQPYITCYMWKRVS